MTLSELKRRLETLPVRQKIANQGQLFSEFCEKAAKARRKATAAVAAAQHAKLALGTFDDKEVVVCAKRAGRRAARLYKKLSDDPATIDESVVQSSFASLMSEADAAYNRCTIAWASALGSKLEGRAALANVLAKVLPQEGGEMRKIVEDLVGATGRLPLSEGHALQVRKLLDYFTELINKIGLGDEVGEFLKDVAGPNGAKLRSLEVPKIQAFLNDHNLHGVFRIRLQ